MDEMTSPAAANSGAQGSLANTQYSIDISASPAFQDSFDCIPLELRERPQWVVWRVEHVNGKLTKVPYTPNTIRHARTNDANTWRAFDECVAAVRAKQWDGIGFVFTEADDYTGIDFDRADDPQMVAYQTQWAQRLNSYSERSPSGQGLHVIVKGRVPKGIKSKCKIEAYSVGRFFTMTGDVFHDAPIADRSPELNALWAELNADRDRSDDATVSMVQPAREDDWTVYDRATRADNGGKFTRLWNGDLSEHGNDHSRADAALCEMLAFYTSSAEQIERLWMQSPLGNRDKTQKRKDYRNRTIRAALARVESRRPPPVDTSAVQRQLEAMVSSPIPTPQSSPAGFLGASFSPPPVSSNVIGWNAFMQDSQPPFYVWHHVLEAGSLYAFTALWGAGKTAIGLTISLHVATGRPLFGRRTARSKVLYLCGENPNDVKLRVRAAAPRLGIDPNMLEGWMHFTKRPFAIDNPNALAAFVADAAPYGPFGLVIVDTGPAHSEAEDENDNRQMHKLAMALRDLMAPLSNPATLVLMHPTKNASRETLEPRGGGAFAGSVDGLLYGWRANKDEPVELFHKEKFRGPGFDSMHFELERHTFENFNDNFGEPVKTVVAVPTEEKPKRETRLTGAALIAFNALEHCLHDGSAVAPNQMILSEYPVFAPPKVVPENFWRARCYEVGISHGEGDAKTKAFNRARKALTEAGVVRTFADHYWLMNWCEAST